MNSQSLYFDQNSCFAVAPMMDWTDHCCRSFHRVLSSHAFLYTEMITADAIIYGDRQYLLSFPYMQHPLALQIGGSIPEKLAEATQIATDFGYNEINLNVGCPSDRVKSGAFGACLMYTPKLVAQCVAAMKQSTALPVTIKCRIAVDGQVPSLILPDLVSQCVDAGVNAVWVHARKAWLNGLSPKQNRYIPPLDYGCVYQLKQQFPHVFIGINGGITTLEQALKHLEHVDGVMLGRVAYRQPGILLQVDHLFYGKTHNTPPLPKKLDALYTLIDHHINRGGRLYDFTRHMMGLFHSCPGARRFRQILSTDACRPNAGLEVLERALNAIDHNDIISQNSTTELYLYKKL